MDRCYILLSNKREVWKFRQNISFLTKKKNAMKYIYSLLIILFGVSNELYAQETKGSGRIVMNDSIEVDLPEVFIKAEHPLVKISEGKLQFDVPSLIKSKPVDNAFDILGELPGVQKEGDNVSIIGTPVTHILINGRKSSMSIEQIIDLLKSTSASKVRHVDVLYSTPPQYGVRGAAINILIENDRNLKDVLKGEVTFVGKQGYYFSPSGRANLFYMGKRYSVDASYSIGYNQGRNEEEMLAQPTVNGELYDISQDNWYKTRSLSHKVRTSLDIDLKNRDKLSFSYMGSFYDPNLISWRGAVTEFMGLNRIETESELYSHSLMHSARADYVGHSGLNIGVDYTFSRDKDIQVLVNKLDKGGEQSIYTLFRQRVNRGNLYLNKSHKLPQGWVLNYGIEGSYSDTWNESGQIFKNGEGEEDVSFCLQQKDYAANGFIGFTKKFGKKISLDASVSLQYYRATVDSAGEKRTLWNRISPFPQLTFTYRSTPSSVWMISFSSDKSYPSYWMTTPNVHYMNVYTSIVGNTDLKPQYTYTGVVNYILKGKYVFGAVASIQPDKILQQTYQYHDRMQSVFRTINLDVYNTFLLMAVIPFKAGNFMSSKLTLSGAVLHQRGVLYDISFNRTKLFGRAALTNTFFLTKDKNVSLELSGYCISPVIQGLYDVERISNVSMGLVWTFAKNKMRLTLRGEDLFLGRSPVTCIDEQGQKSRMKLFQDSRNVTLTLRCSLGGYKEKKVKAIDTSRFGTGM